MRILLKVLFAALLLVLVVAVGTEVVALHRSTTTMGPAVPAYPVVVVRKASGTIPFKTVRRCNVAQTL